MLWLYRQQPTVWSLERLALDASAEPLTIAETRAHLRVTAVGSPPAHPDDTLIAGLIAAARENVEAYCGRSILPQRWRLKLDRFPYDNFPVRLPRPPLVELESVKLSGEALIQDDDFALVTDDSFAEIAPLPTSWPTVAPPTPNAVEIIYRAGYVDGSPSRLGNVPQSMKLAMLLFIGHWYENREAVVTDSRVQALEMPLAAERLLSPYVARGLV